jgi:hypothetical protein
MRNIVRWNFYRISSQFISSSSFMCHKIFLLTIYIFNIWKCSVCSTLYIIFLILLTSEVITTIALKFCSRPLLCFCHTWTNIVTVLNQYLLFHLTVLNVELPQLSMWNLGWRSIRNITTSLLLQNCPHCKALSLCDNSEAVPSYYRGNYRQTNNYYMIIAQSTYKKCIMWSLAINLFDLRNYLIDSNSIQC